MSEWDNEEHVSEDQKENKIKTDFRLEESVSKKSISKKSIKVEPDEKNIKKLELDASQGLD